MKTLPNFLLAVAIALSLGSCAAPNGGGGGGGVAAESQLGPHSARKFTIAPRRSRTIDPNAIVSMCLVLTVEQSMVGNQQEITARASAHKDGPTGAVQSAQGVQVRITEPGPALASKPRTTEEAGDVTATKAVAATGGKFRTVTAEATMSKADFADAHVTLTIPGDQ